MHVHAEMQYEHQRGTVIAKLSKASEIMAVSKQRTTVTFGLLIFWLKARLYRLASCSDMEMFLDLAAAQEVASRSYSKTQRAFCALV